MTQQILVIDDDMITRMLLQNALQQEGYSVILAASGEEGIQQAQRYRPALIICDWMMPGISGLDVCRQIKQDPALATSIFVLLTSKGAVEDRIKGLDNGADDFLAKPIDPAELPARVRAGLRLYQLNQDLQAQKQRLETELTDAAYYVRSLAPNPLQGEVAINFQFIPCLHLGGDCFDYYWLDPDFLVIYLLDISGHGVGAALLSVSVLNLLRSRALKDVNFYQPSAVLAELNNTFQMDEQGDKYFTIWYGVYNRSTRQLTYASAGHPPALLLLAGDGRSVQQLDTPNMPIGLFEDMTFTQQHCTISPNTELYIFSDGVYEVVHDRYTSWGLEQFEQLLVTEATQQSEVDLSAIIDKARLHHPDRLFTDDVSILQVRFT